MIDRRVILVTGVADYWGNRLANYLLLDPKNHVIGLDSTVPDDEIAGLEFIQTDIRNPLLADLLDSNKVDVVCHMKFEDGSRKEIVDYEFNVLGVIHVLDACASANVSKIVVKSSSSVYGAQADNPAFLDETSAFRSRQLYNHNRHLVELEAIYKEFIGGHQEFPMVILRFANVVGLTANTPMTRFLSQRRPAILLGFDPMMQIIHEDDVVKAIGYAIDSGFSGVCNIAAEDAMPLSRILRLAGCYPARIYHRIAYQSYDILKRTGIHSTGLVPIELDYLRYPCVGDLTQMVEEMGFKPQHSSEETLREFASGIAIEHGVDQGVK